MKKGSSPNGSCNPICAAGEYGNTFDNKCKDCDTAKCATCSNGPNNAVCKTCAPGKYLNGSNCAVCTNECLTCVTTATNCLSCKNTSFLENGSCVFDCSNGYYGNTTN